MAAEELIFKYDVWSCIFRKARVPSSLIMHKRYIYLSRNAQEIVVCDDTILKSNLLMSKLFSRNILLAHLVIWKILGSKDAHLTYKLHDR